MSWTDFLDKVAPVTKIRFNNFHSGDGLKGHVGKGLLQTKHPDPVVIHSPSECDGCGTDLTKTKACRALHLDESGMRCKKKLNWIHVTSSSTATFYLFHPKRGREAMEAARREKSSQPLWVSIFQ